MTPIRTININLFAGPGVGKSVTAASLFVALKMRGIHAELVTEFAKELVYAGTIKDVSQQEIIREQYRRQALLQGKAQVVVTDSPVPQSLVYAKTEDRAALAAYLRELVDPWYNLNVLLHRDLTQGYETAGRYQTQDAAIAFHNYHLAPTLRDFYGADLVDCDVESAVPTLVAQILPHLATVNC